MPNTLLAPFTLLILPFLFGFFTSFLCYHLLYKHIVFFFFAGFEKDRAYRFLFSVFFIISLAFTKIPYVLMEAYLSFYDNYLSIQYLHINEVYRDYRESIGKLYIYGMVSFMFFNLLASPNSPRFKKKNIIDELLPTHQIADKFRHLFYGNKKELTNKLENDVEIYSIEDYKEIMESNLRKGYTIVSYNKDVVTILKNIKNQKKLILIFTSFLALVSLISGLGILSSTIIVFIVSIIILIFGWLTPNQPLIKWSYEEINNEGFRARKII